MTDKKNAIVNKYNIPQNKINKDHIPYLYTTYPQLCCKYDLQEISNDVGPYEYHDAIKYLDDYYSDIKSDYYKKLLSETEKHGNNIHEYPKNVADRIIFEYIKFRKNTHCLTLWPNAQDLVDELVDFLKSYGNVYYVKKIKLNYNGGINLIYQLYSDTQYLSSIDKIKKKMDYIGWKNGVDNYVTAVFFENMTGEKISGSQAEFKTKIRNFMLDKLGTDNKLRGDDLIHINDYYYQTIEYAKMYLHHETIRFLRRQNLERHLNYEFKNCRLYENSVKKWIIENVKPIDYERIIFMGSIILYAYGVRQCRDIDGIISLSEPRTQTENLTENIARFFYNKNTKFFFADMGLTNTKYWKPIWDEKNIKWFKSLNIKNIDDMIFGPSNHFYYNGIKMATLKVELGKKCIRKKYYDYGDIIMTSNILKIKIKLPKNSLVEWIDKNTNSSDNDATRINQFKKLVVDYLVSKYHVKELDAKKIFDSETIV